MGTRSAASSCCGSSRSLAAARLGLLLAAAASLSAQLNTGAIEGILRASDGRPVAGSPIFITGGTGFRAVVHSTSNGRFAVTLPYGRYCLSADLQRGAACSGATVFVAPLQIARVHLVMDASGAMRNLPSPERIPPSMRTYPEAFSLPGLLLSRDPSSVTEPLDFTGLGDHRLAVESQRGISWTDTQYKFQGLDATDSYQPGLPAIFPDVESLDAVVVRSAFSQTASSGSARGRRFS